MAYSKFQSGSGVFTCDICNRRTRMTTQDDDRFCGECYDLLGIQNTLWDDGEESFVNDGFLVVRDGLLEVIKRRGGDIAAVKNDMKDLFAVQGTSA